MGKDAKNWGLLLILATIWGSSFILMKRGMFTSDGEPIFSAAQVGALRMVIAGIVLLPFALRNLKHIQNLKEVVLLGVVGLSGNFFPAFLFTYAQTGISSGYSGMLNSFTPIFTLLISFFVFKNRLTYIQLIGLLIGTVGIILLILSGNNPNKSIQLSGSLLPVLAVVLATLCYAISLTTIKFTLQKFKAIEITSLAFFIVLFPSLFALFQLDTFQAIQTNPHALEGLGFISILSIVGTAFAVLLFNKLISNSSTLFSSSVTYFIPIVAVLIGMSIGEHINILQIGAMTIVLLGVFIANYWNAVFGKKV
jgi:drug/metabolite transporter (DMT)-like permease